MSSVATGGLVFITGASSGIGRALAESVPFPARVVNLSRRPGPDADWVEDVAVDLAEPLGWDRAIAEVARALEGFSGRRLVFLHNAGTLEPIGYAGEVDAEGYRRQVLLNSAAGQILGEAFIRLTAGRSDARRQFATLTSGAAWTVYEGWSGYCAGKAGVDHWVRVVGAEQARRGGCELLSIAPGVIETPMQEQIRAMEETAFPEVEKFRERHREGSNRKPADVAAEIWALLEREDLENGAILDLLRGTPPKPRVP